MPLAVLKAEDYEFDAETGRSAGAGLLLMSPLSRMYSVSMMAGDGGDDVVAAVTRLDQSDTRVQKVSFMFMGGYGHLQNNYMSISTPEELMRQVIRYDPQVMDGVTRERDLDSKFPQPYYHPALVVTVQIGKREYTCTFKNAFLVELRRLTSRYADGDFRHNAMALTFDAQLESVKTKNSLGKTSSARWGRFRRRSRTVSTWWCAFKVPPTCHPLPTMWRPSRCSSTRRTH